MDAIIIIFLQIAYYFFQKAFIFEYKEYNIKYPDTNSHILTFYTFNYMMYIPSIKVNEILKYQRIINSLESLNIMGNYNTDITFEFNRKQA